METITRPLTTPAMRIACSICHDWLDTSDPESIGENPVYRFGELNYIELFHITCQVQRDRNALGLACAREFYRSLLP